jgi:hypothetical protein
MSQGNSPLSPGAVVFFESYLHVVTDVALVLKVSISSLHASTPALL